MGWEGWRGVEGDGVEFVERGSGGWEGWWEGVMGELNDEDEGLLSMSLMSWAWRWALLEDYELQV